GPKSNWRGRAELRWWSGPSSPIAWGSCSAAPPSPCRLRAGPSAGRAPEGRGRTNRRGRANRRRRTSRLRPGRVRGRDGGGGSSFMLLRRKGEGRDEEGSDRSGSRRGGRQGLFGTHPFTEPIMTPLAKCFCRKG